MNTPAGADDGGSVEALALFPLQTVLFPGGRLALKVFEARYLDLVSDCLRRGSGFGVVCLTRGGEVRHAAAGVQFEPAGVVARIDAVDAEQPGVLKLACRGTRRFRLSAPAEQRADGLWVAPRAQWLADDAPTPPAAEVQPTVRALAQAIDRLAAQGTSPFVEPYRFDDAGWVANRWCEILPIPIGAKQKLMELDDPALRLQLVHEFLVTQGVIGG